MPKPLPPGTLSFHRYTREAGNALVDTALGQMDVSAILQRVDIRCAVQDGSLGFETLVSDAPSETLAVAVLCRDYDVSLDRLNAFLKAENVETYVDPAVIHAGKPACPPGALRFEKRNDLHFLIIVARRPGGGFILAQERTPEAALASLGDKYELTEQQFGSLIRWLPWREALTLPDGELYCVAHREGNGAESFEVWLDAQPPGPLTLRPLVQGCTSPEVAAAELAYRYDVSNDRVVGIVPPIADDPGRPASRPVPLFHEDAGIRDMLCEGVNDGGRAAFESTRVLPDEPHLGPKTLPGEFVDEAGEGLTGTETDEEFAVDCVFRLEHAAMSQVRLNRPVDAVVIRYADKLRALGWTWTPEDFPSVQRIVARSKSGTSTPSKEELLRFMLRDQDASALTTAVRAVFQLEEFVNRHGTDGRAMLYDFPGKMFEFADKLRALGWRPNPEGIDAPPIISATFRIPVLTPEQLASDERPEEIARRAREQYVPPSTGLVFVPPTTGSALEAQVAGRSIRKSAGEVRGTIVAHFASPALYDAVVAGYKALTMLPGETPAALVQRLVGHAPDATFDLLAALTQIAAAQPCEVMQQDSTMRVDRFNAYLAGSTVEIAKAALAAFSATQPKQAEPDEPSDTEPPLANMATTDAPLASAWKQYGGQIIGRLKSEKATGVFDAELDRCLSGCVAGGMLVRLSRDARNAGLLTAASVTPSVLSQTDIAPPPTRLPAIKGKPCDSRRELRTTAEGLCYGCGMWTPANNPEAHDHTDGCIEVLRETTKYVVSSGVVNPEGIDFTFFAERGQPNWLVYARHQDGRVMWKRFPFGYEPVCGPDVADVGQAEQELDLLVAALRRGEGVNPLD